MPSDESSNGTHWSLEDLHEIPWSKLEGAYVEVKSVYHEDSLDLAESNRVTEQREGEVVGRHTGWKVKWLPDDGSFADPVRDMIVLQTAEESYLEVPTDQLENELLSIEFEDGDSDA